MTLGLLAELVPITLALAFGVALLAGVIKGAVGFALPLVMVSGLSSIMDPKFALAGMLVSVVASNTLQTFREGVSPAVDAVKQFWRYLLTVCVAIFLTAQLVPVIPSEVFYFVLGVPVVFLSVIQLAGMRLTIPPERRVQSEWIIGTISGVFGGLAGTWGPTTVLYLMAIDTPKAKQMVVQGLIYGAGSYALFIAHLRSGILNDYTWVFSAILLPMVLIGMWAGFKIQDRLDQAKFRRLTLIVIAIAGLNLLRKGFLG